MGFTWKCSAMKAKHRGKAKQVSTLLVLVSESLPRKVTQQGNPLPERPVPVTRCQWQSSTIVHQGPQNVRFAFHGSNISVYKFKVAQYRLEE